jgi:DNA (cytosine-5)-methyltransferase 1
VREANGISRGMDGKRGRFIGNAVAPPISEFIGKRILAIEEVDTEARAAR